MNDTKEKEKGQTRTGSWPEVRAAAGGYDEEEDKETTSEDDQEDQA
jgi:hypothetical protein